MLTRKALIAKLQSMNLDTVLFPGYKRTHNWRGYAAIEALRPLLEIETFNQEGHVNARGECKENPTWLKQLYTDLAWSQGDIQAGTILQALQ